MSHDDWLAMAIVQEDLDVHHAGFSEYAQVWSGESNVITAGRQASLVTPEQAASSTWVHSTPDDLPEPVLLQESPAVKKRRSLSEAVVPA